jgi:hypothetical protein
MYKLQGQTGPTVTRWTAREASIVTIGANHNALAFYDRQTGELIDLTDNYKLIRLLDTNTVIHENKENMKLLTGILNLADTATETEVADAIRVALSDRDRLKTENTDLTARIDALNQAAKDAQKAEAIALVDAAVKDGRVDAKGKEAFIKLFDTDFDSAKATLEAIPARQSVAARIQNAGAADAVEMADLQKMTWEELDRAGKLTLLKDKYTDLYAEKFEARFGTKLKSV